MKSSTKNVMFALLLSSSALLATVAYRRRQKELQDNRDISNTEKIDEVESVDADKDPAEIGLTQLDSTYRAEWIANGFPQTHQEMKELEELEKEEKTEV